VELCIHGNRHEVEHGDLCYIEWSDPAGSSRDGPGEVTTHFLKSNLQFIRQVDDSKRGAYLQFGHTYDEDEGSWYGCESIPLGCILTLAVTGVQHERDGEASD